MGVPMPATEVFNVKPIDAAFTTYDVELHVLDKIIGGVPKDPDTIRKWLAARLEMGDRELIELAEQTYQELSGDTGRHPSTDEQLDAIMSAQSAGNTFKRHPVTGNLAYEGRCMKAALKEAANIAYPGTKFPGKPADIRKGLMRYLAEVVFVPDLYIDLGVSEPSGTEQRIKHVSTPQGPRSAINIVDYVERPVMKFQIEVLHDTISLQVWSEIWQELERIGLGADRARSDGRFSLDSFEPA